jgi:hypothetical protein
MQITVAAAHIGCDVPPRLTELVQVRYIPDQLVLVREACRAVSSSHAVVAIVSVGIRLLPLLHYERSSCNLHASNSIPVPTCTTVVTDTDGRTLTI